MRDIRKNPFEHYDWTPSELEFAMIFRKRKEHILVGTKVGIQDRLRGRGKGETETQLPDDVYVERKLSVTDAVCTAASDVVRTVTDTFSIGPIAATRKEQERIHDRAQAELPLVCDCTYDMGHFLLDFERDPEKKWDAAVSDLVNALKLSGKRSKELENCAREFLKARWDTRDPVCRFAALKIWQDYCAVRRIKMAGEEAVIPYTSGELPQQISAFSSSARQLIDSFWQFPDVEPNLRGRTITRNDPILRLSPFRKSEEDELRLWTVDGVNFEVVALSKSFYPLKEYCRLKMNESGVKYSRCIECGKIFPTHTLKQETCGTVCAKLRKSKTTARYHDRSKGDEVELLCSQAYQYWYNRVRKAKRIEEFPKGQMDTLLAGFESFKRERKNQKKCVIEKSTTMKDFRDWISEQEKSASEIMGQYDERWYASR